MGFSCVDKYEIFLILFNVLFFMVVQTLFFKYIVSKEYDALLEEKMETIKYFLSNDEKLNKDFDILKDNYLNNINTYYGKTNTEVAKEQLKLRKEHNNKLYLYHALIPIAVVIFLIILVLIFIKKGTWSYSTTISLLSVALVYIPEILVFLFVIKKYYHIGNIDVITKLYKELI
jgi:hypothetical protein